MKYISTLNNRGRGSSNRFLPAPRSAGNRYTSPRIERRDRRRIGPALVCACRRAAGPVRKIGKTLFGGAAALFVLGGVSLGLLVGYLGVIHSDYFMVRKVVLSGLDKVTREEILLKTGLDQASNIVTLRLGPMAESIRAIPWVESVTINRKLPDTVLVQLTERRIRTLISLGDLYYLDDNGFPFKKIEAGQAPDLPIITGFDRKAFVERPEFARRDIQEIFRLLETLADRNDRFRFDNIQEINFDEVRGLTLITRDERLQVKIGFGDYENKIKRIGRLMAHLKKNGQSDRLTYLNVETSPRIVVSWAEKT